MSRKQAKILVLPGDGIGPEVMSQATKIIELVAKYHDKLRIKIETGLIGGASIDVNGVPITDEVIRKARSSNAVLLAAIGGPKWDKLDYQIRPEAGLLKLRKKLQVFANLRPIKVFSSIKNISPLKEYVIEETDFIIVRELTGGVYFGKPCGIKTTRKGEKGFDTEVYYRSEIERIARVAFNLARSRRKKVTSVDKANVLKSSILWRNTVNEVHKEFPEIELNHLYIDNCAMQIIKEPRQFDVILTNNIFGDIISDEASVIPGSIGMLPSVSIGGKVALYEPVHGSAPDIAGKNKANPIGIILTVALIFRYSFSEFKIANCIEKAVENVLEQGYRTADISGEGQIVLSTTEIGEKIKEELEKIIA